MKIEIQKATYKQLKKMCEEYGEGKSVEAYLDFIIQQRAEVFIPVYYSGEPHKTKRTDYE